MRKLSKEQFAMLTGLLLEGTIDRDYFKWLIGKGECSCFTIEYKKTLLDEERDEAMRFSSIQYFQQEKRYA